LLWAARALGIVVLLGAAPPVRALAVGEACTLKAPLPVTVQQSRATFDTTFDAGSEVSVLYVGDNGRARVSNGDLKGVVLTKELEAACAGTLRLCTATGAFSLYERNRSDSTSWPVVAGMNVSILRSGKVWAHLIVSDREGFSPVTDVEARCSVRVRQRGDGSTAAPGAEKDTESRGPPVEDVERGDGPGVLVLPFALEEGVPAARADQLAAGFYERLAYFRPDVGQVPSLGSRVIGWKDHVDGATRRARATGHAYALVGRVARENGEDVVSLAVIDAASGRTLKGVRARPRADGDDDWSEPALASLLPPLAAAPGSRLPRPRETTATPSSSTTAAPTNAVATTGADWGAPWFANPWGYVALGVGLAAGGGAAYLSQQALATNDAANRRSVFDEARATDRRRALEQAVAADGLTVLAATAGVTSLVLFIGRIGIRE
jgi:hypothetical protein